VVTKNSSGEVVFINQFSSFVRGIGGFGGATTSAGVKACFVGVSIPVLLS
jgi:hypothetical protein